MLMSACSQPIISATSECPAFGLIYPSRKDTEETKRQVLNHNVIYEKVCSDRDKKEK
ncbi:hypothetical protein I141_10870 [Pasteurella multocida P1933]|nr:hypothetical protein I141_10870 [Pasteurella multocida P1933]